MVLDALKMAKDRLLDELEKRIVRKKEQLCERERAYGKNKVYIGSYLENIALPDLFGFDMNDYFRDPRFLIETELRYRIFMIDNSEDDNVPDLVINSTTGMYFDMTLFGLKINHTKIGVPEFQHHPIASKPDLSLLPPFDFHTAGDMPLLIEQYSALREISKNEYDGKLKIGFPSFHRGPLDVYIQMRSYDNFVNDTILNPSFVHGFLGHIVAERERYNRERAKFLGEEYKRETTFIGDDWMYHPFISPFIFDEYVVPAYRKIQENEGNVTGFHTCGVLAHFAPLLLNLFPHVRYLDVSGWNDFAALDQAVDHHIAFSAAMKNTFVLTSSEAEQRRLLEILAAVAQHRTVSIGAGAIVRVHPTFDETIDAMNRFIRLTHEIVCNRSKG